MMRLPLLDPQDPKSIDFEQLNPMVDLFLERGFTYFDTAYGYHQGESEAAFRKAVSERYPRDRYTITDKMPVWLAKEEADYERIFNTQLERAGVDYFDYYWLHALNRTLLASVDACKGWEFIARKKAEGKVRHIGFSFHDEANVLEGMLKAHPEVEFVQLQINYIDWDSPSVQARECYELCVEYGKKVIVMEPVKGGSLALVPDPVGTIFKEHSPEASPASWAIRYVASLPEVAMVLSGMSDLNQVDDNTSFMQEFKPMDEEEQGIVADAARLIKDSITIPCTACHYCTDGCPMNIAIPEYFALYNSLRQFGKTAAHNSKYYYNRFIAHRGKASDCIECGQCEEHCPQHIDIIANLKLVAKEYE